MNYTEKYHLPQWEESDRVLRTDFNQMCQDMEAGLLQNDLTNGDSLKKALFRLAYNHYQHMMELKPRSGQQGICFRDFAQQSGGGFSNAMALKGRQWTAKTDRALTLEDLLPTLEVADPVGSTGICSFTFTAPRPGVITWIQVAGRYEGNTNNNSGSCTIYLTNLTTRRTEKLESNTLIMQGTSGGGARMNTELVVHGGQKYRIDIRMQKLDFTSYHTMNFSDPNCLHIEGVGEGESFMALDLPDDRPSQGALFVVHYTTWKDGNRLTIDWPDGTETEPSLVRTITDRYNQTVQEAEFRIDRPHTGGGKATLRLHCAPEGEINVHEWGGLLI